MSIRNSNGTFAFSADLILFTIFVEHQFYQILILISKNVCWLFLNGNRKSDKKNIDYVTRSMINHFKISEKSIFSTTRDTCLAWYANASLVIEAPASQRKK